MPQNEALSPSPQVTNYFPAQKRPFRRKPAAETAGSWNCAAPISPPPPLAHTASRLAGPRLQVSASNRFPMLIKLPAITLSPTHIVPHFAFSARSDDNSKVRVGAHQPPDRRRCSHLPSRLPPLARPHRRCRARVPLRYTGTSTPGPRCCRQPPDCLLRKGLYPRK